MPCRGHEWRWKFAKPNLHLILVFWLGSGQTDYWYVRFSSFRFKPFTFVQVIKCLLFKHLFFINVLWIFWCHIDKYLCLCFQPVFKVISQRESKYFCEEVRFSAVKTWGVCNYHRLLSCFLKYSFKSQGRNVSNRFSDPAHNSLLQLLLFLQSTLPRPSPSIPPPSSPLAISYPPSVCNPTSVSSCVGI